MVEELYRVQGICGGRMSLFTQHIDRWKGGCGASICPRATKRCFARGSIPAMILFIAEAPGESEDSIGAPMVGPAGHLFDSIIKQAVPVDVTYCITNLTLCIPTDAEGNKNGEPDHDDIQKCRPRLEEFITIVNPRLIVAVGKLAKDYLERGFRHNVRYDSSIRVVDVIHPAAIIRGSEVMKNISIKRTITTIQNAIRSLEEQCL